MKKAAVQNLSTAGRRRPAGDKQHERAEELAVDALVFLAADRDRFRSLAESSGISPENLRAAATSPDFLSGILDYLVADESLLRAFAANRGIGPSEIERARRALAPKPEE